MYITEESVGHNYIHNTKKLKHDRLVVRHVLYYKKKYTILSILRKLTLNRDMLNHFFIFK